MRASDDIYSKLRCQSTGSNQNTSISSILKSPTKSKLKHQRSVRFEEPLSQNEASFEVHPPSKLSPNSSFTVVNPSPKARKEPFAAPPYAKVHRATRSTANADEFTAINPSAMKIITIAKLARATEAKTSPKAHQNASKLGCRDDKFYQKLNFYLSGKRGSVSENNASDGVGKEEKGEFKSGEKKKEVERVERNFEVPVISWDIPEVKISAKKVARPGTTAGKTAGKKGARGQGPNLLN
jgi:hypothetical protein